jgi:gluconolactonase
MKLLLITLACTCSFFLLLATDLRADDGQSLLADGAKVTKLAGGMKFTEGPVWLPENKILVFSDIPNSKLMQWSSAGGLAPYRDSQEANGNIIDFQGRILSCQHKARNVIRIEKDGKETVLADRFDGKRFNSPNDLAIRSDGTLWFTDPPWGLTGAHEIPGHWVYRLELETGKIEPVVKDLAMPNGIVFSPDEKRLYIADTGGHPRHPWVGMSRQRSPGSALQRLLQLLWLLLFLRLPRFLQVLWLLWLTWPLWRPWLPWLPQLL